MTRHPTRRTAVLRSTALAVSAVAAVCGIGACTGSGGGAKSAGGAHYAAAAGGAAAPQARAAGSAAAAKSAAGGSARTVLGDLALGPSKIRNASMTVTVKRGESLASKADSADSIATQAGGEVDADERSSGPGASAELTLRVPPDRLTEVLAALSRLGTEQSRQLSTQDVTSKVADVTSRVNSAKLSIDRLRALYQHATKIADVITIESELADRESDLESLEAQQRALAAETGLATVNLSLISQRGKAVVKPTVKHHHRTGFLGGLHNGWDAFSRGAAALATAVGALLPFLALALLIGVAVRLLWPRLRPPRRPAPAAPPAPSA